MSEPRWLSRVVTLAIHADQLEQHGGLSGVRDPNVLESSLNRAPTRLHHKPDADLAELAAAHGFAFATAHPFVDGNKRTAFICTYVFLGLNRLRLVAPETDVVRLMTGVAEGSVGEDVLAAWLRSHTGSR